MNSYKAPNTTIPTTSILKLAVLTFCLIILTSSMILFVSDRGNLIAYTYEHIQGWKNPTYQEMQNFVNKDLTNYKSYQEYQYECKHFTIDFIKKARQQGYRAGYVTLINPHGYDHAISCFETTDKGLYFIEPQTDCIFDQKEMNTMISSMEYNPYQIQENNHLIQPLSDYRISWYMVL